MTTLKFLAWHLLYIFGNGLPANQKPITRMSEMKKKLRLYDLLIAMSFVLGIVATSLLL